MSLIHYVSLHDLITTVSLSSSNTCSPTYAWKSTSEAGANPGFCLPLSIQHVPSDFFALLVRGGGGSLHLTNNTSFCSPQCQIHSLKPCLHSAPEKRSLLTFQGVVDRHGRMKYTLCFPHIFSLVVATSFLISAHVFFPMAFLQGGILYLTCVFFKTIDDYICVLSVPLSGSVGWTCLCATIFSAQGFSCSAPGHEDPLETLPSPLEGRYTFLTITTKTCSLV